MSSLHLTECHRPVPFDVSHFLGELARNFLCAEKEEAKEQSPTGDDGGHGREEREAVQKTMKDGNIEWQSKEWKEWNGPLLNFVVCCAAMVSSALI